MILALLMLQNIDNALLAPKRGKTKQKKILIERQKENVCELHEKYFEYEIDRAHFYSNTKRWG